MVEVDSVTIDAREPDEFSVLFEEHEDVDRVSMNQIPTGDFLLRPDMEEPAVVFERKSVSDYVGSIKSRRLETQIKMMYEEFGPERSFLLVEGDMDEFDFLPYSDFSSASVRGFTASISARWQCVPLFCSDKVKMVDMAVRVSRKMVEEPSRKVRSPTNTPEQANDTFIDRALLQLDGVGKDTKEKLKERYPSVQYLAEAGEHDLQKIDGIGSTTAEKIVNQLEGQE